MESNKIDPRRVKLIIRLFHKQAEIYTDHIKKLMKKAKKPAEAIVIACECKDLNGKRESHHYRRTEDELEGWKDKVLSKETEISKIRTFGELHEILRHIAGDSYGVGPLLTYDTADKLRVFRKLKLDRLYLHAGTRTGARLFLQKRLGATLEYKDLPAAFRKLPYEDLENLFCICKNLLDSSISDHEFQRQYQDFRHKFLRVKNC